MNRFPAFAALAFALTTLCACDPYQFMAPQGETLPHQVKNGSTRAAPMTVRPHKAKASDKLAAPMPKCPLDQEGCGGLPAVNKNQH